MSFWITVAVPLPNDFKYNVETLKEDGMHFVPERKCWVGETGDEYDGVATIVGGFVCENEECPFPASWSKEKLLKTIDLSCDFTMVGRKNEVPIPQEPSPSPLDGQQEPK